MRTQPSGRLWARAEDPSPHFLGIWPKRALVLVLVTFVYNLGESGLALWSGLRAGSVALMGFGLESVVECGAAAVLFWRLRLEWRGVDDSILETAERRVHRFVGATFYALAAYVLAQAAWTLTLGENPAESTLGIALAIASLIIMPPIALGKLRAAREIRSRALRAEAKETLACTYLSLTLLLGLGTNALWSWWWADPIAALAMVPWLLREGREGLRSKCD